MATSDERLRFEAAIRANAIGYRVHLFLGRGQFDRAEADTLLEAIAIGDAMKAAHPTVHAQPIYYAIEPSGHSTTITPAQFQEQTNMIKTAVTTESASIDVINAQTLKADARRAKNAERMRAARAKAKNTQSVALGSPEFAASDIAKANAASWLVPNGGPVSTRPRRKGAAERIAKVQAELAQPKPNPVIVTAKPATGKRAEGLAAAQRGELPVAPDFTAETHKRWRKALADIVAMIDAGNVAGLVANKVEPKSSSRVAICRYRDLAIVALKTRAV